MSSNFGCYWDPFFNNPDSTACNLGLDFCRDLLAEPFSPYSEKMVLDFGVTMAMGVELWGMDLHLLF